MANRGDWARSELHSERAHYRLRRSRPGRLCVQGLLSEEGDGAQPAGRRHVDSRDRRFYFKCFPTSLVISNMFTDALPPKTVFRAVSALIMRRFFLSWSPFFLM